ncbi:MAG: nitrous oxide reductase family maturation protein NosD [Myxococcales bacterium]|nr:nitrous oxide reductase family maturation protein NosD [Myxococcales bacterium]
MQALVIGFSVLATLLLPSAAARAETLRAGVTAPTLQATIDLSGEGDIVEVPPGTWKGPIVIRKRITLRGTGGAIDGGGEGTTIVVEAAGAVVEKLEVLASGSDLSGLQPDSCIFLRATAVEAIVRDNRLHDCSFGIWVHASEAAQILRNDITGRSELRTTDRGNGIQLFDASNLVVGENVVRGARDGIYISATDDSLIRGNIVEDQRYGVHYMFSYRNTLRGNTSRRNVGGFALMESRELIVEDNIAEENERTGILFRDAEDCFIRNNQLIRNGQGLFFFSSVDNTIEYNHLFHNEVGAKIWAGSLRNRISLNAFVGNRQQIFYVGTKDLVLSEDYPGNYWSDYIGWDQDGDGIGDRPYETESFSSTLVYRYPAASMLLHSPALEMLTYMQERLPILKVPTVVDRRPQMSDIKR